jgi:hypothetical protein
VQERNEYRSRSNPLLSAGTKRDDLTLCKTQSRGFSVAVGVSQIFGVSCVLGAIDTNHRACKFDCLVRRARGLLCLRQSPAPPPSTGAIRALIALFASAFTGQGLGAGLRAGWDALAIACLCAGVVSPLLMNLANIGDIGVHIYPTWPAKTNRIIWNFEDQEHPPFFSRV